MDNVAYVGQVLAGKYRIDRVLGVGGMGVVVAAHHLELDSKVAIKFLLPDTLGNPDAVARFAREARAAVRIKSEHVARVSDVGKLENGAPYMVMEYLEGLDLSGWLSERGPLPVTQALDFALQASEAIAEAHALGIVHRDLKPANLFVITRPDGGLSLKVLDFGISKSTSLGGSGGEGSMTKTSTMLGSPLYMSPEQIQSSRDVDARADIWALGVIIYELLTGVAPFGGEHLAELIFAIISAQPPAMRAYRPDLPEGLEGAILRCLAKNRGERFSTVAEMASALLPFASPRGHASMERISGVTAGASPGRDIATAAIGPSSPNDTGAYYAAAGTQASWGNTNRNPQAAAAGTLSAPRKRKSVWLVAGLGGAVVSLIAGLLLARSLTSPSVAPGGAASGLITPASASPAQLPKPEPALPVATDSAVSVSPAPSSNPVTQAASIPTASTQLKPPTQPKAKPKPPTTPQAPRDPWGGSQH